MVISYRDHKAWGLDAFRRYSNVFGRPRPFLEQHGLTLIRVVVLCTTSCNGSSVFSVCIAENDRRKPTRKQSSIKCNYHPVIQSTSGTKTRMTSESVDVALLLSTKVHRCPESSMKVLQKVNADLHQISISLWVPVNIKCRNGIVSLCHAIREYCIGRPFCAFVKQCVHWRFGFGWRPVECRCSILNTAVHSVDHQRIANALGSLEFVRNTFVALLRSSARLFGSNN